MKDHGFSLESIITSPCGDIILKGRECDLVIRRCGSYSQVSLGVAAPALTDDHHVATLEEILAAETLAF